MLLLYISKGTFTNLPNLNLNFKMLEVKTPYEMCAVINNSLSVQEFLHL